MDDDIFNHTNAKYEYLNAPCLIETFKKNYLTSLNIFLNDDKFKEKTDSLPILKSSAITKYEKLISKEEAELLKKRKLKLKNKNIQPLILETDFTNNSKKKMLTANTTPNFRKKINPKKRILVRYIIIDHELIELSLKAIEENNEINNKLTDPFNAYFHEQNPKVRKKALEQIINNIIPKKKTKKDADNEELKEIKFFRESCNNNNIITLDQKIDYFAYLYKNKMFNIPTQLKKPTMHKISSKKFNKKQFKATSSNKTNTNNNNIETPIKPAINFNYNNLLENNIKYTNELKNNFRINDELLSNNNHILETFQRDIDTKVKSFQLLKNNFESSQKFIDKLRLALRCEEVTQEKIILRNCDINSDKFYFLINKKYFDFGTLKFINLDNNQLGDIGGAYLLLLIPKFSNKIDYLNISNNKIGKQSCEILIDILQKNNVKLIGLSIGGNKLGDKLFSDISEAISKNLFLQKLFIHNNELGKITSAILGTILKYDKKLKLLDVSGNDFGDENISFMLKGLICNSSLETLMMNNMDLTNKSLRIFETTLGINTTLKKLFLERNKINYKGWRLLSEILNKNKHIEYISLVGNNFENQHINYIIEQQRQIKLRTISKTDYFMQITSSNEEEINLYEYIE